MTHAQFRSQFRQFKLVRRIYLEYFIPQQKYHGNFLIIRLLLSQY